MQSTGLSAVTASTAHREWATRPSDERFASVSALYDAARARRLAAEERVIETNQFRTEADTHDDLVLHESSGQTASLTHWSFEQLAGIAGAPPKYLRTLPALGGHLKTGHFSRRPRPMEFYFVGSSERKSVCTLVRQLRGPHLSTCA
jgi:hypothetical protein